MRMKIFWTVMGWAVVVLLIKIQVRAQESTTTAVAIVVAETPMAVRADFPADTMLFADVKDICVATGDNLAVTAFAAKEDIWIHVWQCVNRSKNVEEGVESIGQGIGMFFGSDVA